MKRIGIVGSRRRTTKADRNLVFKIVRLTAPDTVIVSGGAKKGADKFAEQAAKFYGRKMVVHYPDLEGCVAYHEFVVRYYARNKKIADDVDELHALVHSDREGGTENTIKHAKLRGIPVIEYDTP